MRRMILVGCLMLLPLLTGCTIVTDFLFAAFSDGYTEGGYTPTDKKSHFDHQRESSGHYSPWNQ